jgi:hypothetical protein
MTAERFIAKRKVLLSLQSLKSTPEKIFPLLCPTREYEWIENWKCELIHSESGFAELDCFFTTEIPGEKNDVWYTDRYEANKCIQFIRVSEKRVIRYLISLNGNSDGTTTALWEQVVTALNEDGNQYIESLSDIDFSKHMKSLEKILNYYLETGEMYRTEKSNG